MTRSLGIRRARALQLALGCLLAAAAGRALAAPPGLQMQPPSARSEAVTRPRIAILLVPQPASTSTRAALALADEEAISRQLRELGFEVWTQGPGTRPELARSVREMSARVPEGADVVVLTLGAVFSGPDDVFLVPAGSSADSGSPNPALLEADGLRLGDLLRRLAERRPRDLVVIVDECRPTSSEHCPLDQIAAQASASIVAAERASADRSGASGPMAALASLRDPMLRAALREGQTFLGFHDALRSALAGTDLAVVASARLSTSFSFIPTGFFAGMRTECGRLDPNAEATAVRALALDPLVRACETSQASYPYATFFASQLAAAREQRAFQRAVASCEDRLAASTYLSGFPAGRFRGVVEALGQDCERRRLEQIADRQRQQDHADEQRRREDELRRQEEARRQDEARRVEQQRRSELSPSGTFYYVTGLDSNGDNWLALRTAPSFRAGWSQTRMGPGTLLTLLGREGDWLHVRLLSGETGYAFARYVACCRN